MRHSYRSEPVAVSPSWKPTLVYRAAPRCTLWWTCLWTGAVGIGCPPYRCNVRPNLPNSPAYSGFPSTCSYVSFGAQHTMSSETFCVAARSFDILCVILSCMLSIYICSQYISYHMHNLEMDKISSICIGPVYTRLGDSRPASCASWRMIPREWEECQKLLPVDIQMKNEDGKIFKINKK